MGGGTQERAFSFVKKRWKKISVTYYPFLIISMAVLLMAGQEVTWKNVLTHFTYSNYIISDTICGISFGHLWYISMMMVCYIGIALMKQCRYFAWLFEGRAVLLTVIATIGGGLLLQRMGISSRVAFLFTSYLLVYRYADRLYDWTKKKSATLLGCVMVVLSAVTLSLFYVDGFYDMLMTRDTMIMLTAMAWMMFFLNVSDRVRPAKWVTALSAVSFEVYLIHQPFLFGKFSLLGMTGYGYVVDGAIAMTIIMVLAWMLHKIGSTLKRVMF